VPAHPPAPRAFAAAAIATTALLGPAAADAHAPGAGAGHSVPWPFEPWLLALLAASLGLYTLGALRLWRHAGLGRGIRLAHAGAFAAGWLAVAIALASPLDPLGERRFSAHMVQHELLMLVAAPLFVVARPLSAWTWALPAPSRRGVGGALRAPGWRRVWGALRSPLGAWLLHAAALWGWHTPALFSLALRDPLVHTLQHASFLGTGLLFWWAVLGSHARARAGVALVSLFTTMVHATVLGALITLSPQPWYPEYAATGAAPGFDALADQQLGGLLMWVPGGLAYLAVGLWLAAHWLGPDEAPGTGLAPAQEPAAPEVRIAGR